MCSETSVEFAACKKMFCLVLETMMEHKAISVIYWQILILIAISLCLKSNPGIILLKEMIRFDKWVLRQKYSFLKPALISFVFHTQRKQKFRNINQCGLLAVRVMGSGTSSPRPALPGLLSLKQGTYHAGLLLPTHRCDLGQRETRDSWGCGPEGPGSSLPVSSGKASHPGEFTKSCRRCGCPHYLIHLMRASEFSETIFSS